MLALIFIGSFIFLLGLILLLSLTPPNTICPRCKQKKPFQQHGWKTLCLKCERSDNE